MGDLKPEEEVAFYYLKDIVGNMKQELLERFLHFITGRPSASLGAITVAINHAGMVEASSSGVNKAQLEGTHNNRVIVPVKVQHFRLSNDEPRMVYYKENKSSAEQSFMLLKDPTIVPPPAVLPARLNPEGLSDKRKSYLYYEIRQFCKHGTEDLVVPAP
ncbi:hypothetical protein OS493_009057 [Desmophyllum pertusum]|uniref:Uncharacterized protein n=1 Tax=Desmophyllum pertusum TaxID=174260 RepID=A0A9W9ZFW6_9CNID|nr:hypothetical protein OS493_009057 [Desmophyllum pertusum]